MRVLKYTLLAALFAVLLPQAAQAKGTMLPKAYLYGFIANFTDSVVYFTDIQEVDSVWYDKKTKFLLGRSSYSAQLKNYFTYTLNKPNSTCIVSFGLTRKAAEKKYAKLKKQYTDKHAGAYEIRSLNENEFRFTPVNMAPDEEPQMTKEELKEAKKKAKEAQKAKKNKKDGKRPPRDGNMPPPPGNGGPR